MVQGLRPNSCPYLFAQFAWATLLLVKPFITANVPHHVICLQVMTGMEVVKTMWKADLLTRAWLKSSYSGG
ncbi:hypothetical protein FQN55_003978, partial [Onygenales sp. PD_40]